MKYSNDANYISNLSGKTGILITNLGSPNSPSPADVRRYLAEFLADPRIVEAPRWLWTLALHGVILRTRPKKAAHAYQKVWTDKGSPLLVITQDLVNKLTTQFAANPGPVKFEIEMAMRYGNPSIKSAIEKLIAKGVERILLFPLYPQFSATTTASTLDAVFDSFRTMRAIPELRVINQYFDHPAYINALANSIKDKRNPDSKLVMSFHGLPQQYVDQGDPYQQQCLSTANALAKKLQLNDDEWVYCFQSRFGPKKWLQPYADATLEQLPKDGVSKIDVVCPGFSADCLETLEEIDMQNREVFLSSGGSEFNYIPALNDSQAHVEALHKIILEHCQGWGK